ncbi:MAG: hypothetical protein ACMUIG_05925 [Thermoplasmatota archaeon]
MEINWAAVGAVVSAIVGAITIAIAFYKMFQSRKNSKKAQGKGLKKQIRKETIRRKDKKKGPRILFDDIIHVEPRSVETRKIFFERKEIVKISVIEKNKRKFDYLLLTEDEYHKYLKKSRSRKILNKKGIENSLMEIEIQEESLHYFVFDCSMKKIDRDIHMTIHQIR